MTNPFSTPAPTQTKAAPAAPNLDNVAITVAMLRQILTDERNLGNKCRSDQTKALVAEIVTARKMISALEARIAKLET